MAHAFICRRELKFGIFFDGTGNHRYFDFIKTQFLLKKHPLTNLSQNADIDPKRHTSLLSNVARLSFLFKEDEKNGVYSIYVPGVGTPFNNDKFGSQFEGEGNNTTGEGSLFGSAFGAGGNDRICYAFYQIYEAIWDTGVKSGQFEKHKWNYKGAENNIDTLPKHFNDQLILELEQRKKRSSSCVDSITLWIFGFSRGAAEARSFVNRLAKLSGSPDGSDLKFGNITVKVEFMGIFDTVASVGVVNLPNMPQWSLVDGHWSWALPENLHIPQSIICHHYVATNEARICFPLTLSTVNTNHSLRLYPGVHSDVGGGYGYQYQGKYDMSVVPGRDMYEAAKKIVPFKEISETTYSQLSAGNISKEIVVFHDFTEAYEAINEDFKAMIEAMNPTSGNQLLCSSQNSVDLCKEIAQYQDSYFIYRGIMLRKITPNNTPHSNNQYQTQLTSRWGCSHQVPRYEWQPFYLRAVADAHSSNATENDKKPTPLPDEQKKALREAKQQESYASYLSRQQGNNNAVIGLKRVNDLLEEGLSWSNRHWLKMNSDWLSHKYQPRIREILTSYSQPKTYPQVGKQAKVLDEYEHDNNQKAIKKFYNDYVHDSQASFYIEMGLLEYNARVRMGGKFVPFFGFLGLGNGQGLARYRTIYEEHQVNETCNKAKVVPYEQDLALKTELQTLKLNGKDV